MSNRFLTNRREFIAGATFGLFVSPAAFALNKAQADTLINNLTNDILTTIDSGKTGRRLYTEFERIFARYADVRYIARKSLGSPWRSASDAQKNAFAKEFTHYLSRKYGKRFKEFLGATIKVKNSRKAKGGYLVESIVTMSGQSPFVVEWQVSDKSGRNLMFNMYIEGINMLQTEQAEIGAMYDKNRRDINKLIAYLKTVG